MSSDATRSSLERLLAAAPVLTEIAPLAALQPPPADTLLHAGPPHPDPADLPAPVFNAVVAAAALEGWAEGPAETRAALAAGRLRLAPAQDHGVVTPLAFVVGPSTPCLKIADAAAPGRFKLAPLNDGPPPLALRFGTGSAEGMAILRRLKEAAAAELAAALRGPTPMLPILAAGLAGGDDLHGRVAAAQAALLEAFARPMGAAAEEHLKGAGQFALNAVMATAALMLAAGEGVADSALVTAAGGNGRLMGWRRADAPAAWITAPAAPPLGPKLPGRESAQALPAIGDSAVIDALGLGAATLRFSPELLEALRPSIEAGEIDPAYLTEAAQQPYLAEHPALGQPAIRLGLDLGRPRAALGIMLGMVEATGRDGLIGRGVAPWPAP